MAQAIRKRKASSSSPGRVALAWLNQRIQQSVFLVLLAVALYLLLALISQRPEDGAWTHTGVVDAVGNWGGAFGALFADITGYFLGYGAYLLPLGLAFGGWRLFQQRGLSTLDAEIVIFRSLGTGVGLASLCGLASLRLEDLSAEVSAGGQLGHVVSQSLVNAFGYAGGSLFLLVLSLAGLTLATGLSWSNIVDRLGNVVWKLVVFAVGLVGAAGAKMAARRQRHDDSATIDEELESSTPETEQPSEIERGDAALDMALQAQQERVDTGPMLGGNEQGDAGPFDEQDNQPAAMEHMTDSDNEPLESASSSAVSDESLESPPLGAPTINDDEAAEAPPREPITLAKAPEHHPAPRRDLTHPASIPAVPLDPLPSVTLLDQSPDEHVGFPPEVLERMSRQLETQLKHFGVEVTVTCVKPGPVITCFEIEPAPGVKVSQITNLSKDLARGLSVISVRVVEVIPGKSVIGLEIPNERREIVYLREILESKVYTAPSSALTLALGKDIIGNPVVANLAKMPHLLVAGTTGSGKSVAINVMLLSMLYKAPPEQVRLILVDPKMLELSIYEGIPHLLAPVVTDMKEAANALRWCVAEMERRYRLMAALKVRNVAGFNRVVTEAAKAGEPIADPLFKAEDHLGEEGEIPTLSPLPFIVVVIDELADMMMIVGKKVEELIARLAQKARASGIHLILATQRPSVDVITGLIKANIPTRMAFQVSSKTDSRTILDQMGAEALLGHGDMLFLPPGTGLPQRVHGAFVDDHEVNRVVDYLRQTGEPDYIGDIVQEPAEPIAVLPSEMATAGSSSGEEDPLYDEAVRIVTETRRASISGVQRRLKIGYNRAARMIEEMEAAGIVGPLQSNGSREILAPPPPET